MTRMFKTTVQFHYVVDPDTDETMSNQDKIRHAIAAYDHPEHPRDSIELIGFDDELYPDDGDDDDSYEW